MAASNFDPSYKRERVYEGGNDDDPSDRGGRTSRGITQAEWTAWCKLKGMPVSDVWEAPDDQIEAIYRSQYWDAIAGDEMPQGLDLVLFDGAVNSGPHQAILWLQRSLADFKLYSQEPDGVLGNLTKRGAKAAPDVDAIIADMGDRRTAFLKAIAQRDPSQAKYEGGWLARVANVTKAGEAQATGSIGPDPVELPESPKASARKIPEPSITPETGAVVAAGGAVAAAANEALSKASDGAQAISQASGALRYLLLAVVVIGVGFVIWSQMRSRQKSGVTTGQAKLELPRNADEAFPPVSLTPAPAAAAAAEAPAAADAGGGYVGTIAVETVGAGGGGGPVALAPA